jgi:hypothetical protein
MKKLNDSFNVVPAIRDLRAKITGHANEVGVACTSGLQH